jgi:hypothetical protein
VPLADVMVSTRRGFRPRRSRRQVTRRLEKLLYQIDGVEYVYSMSRTPGECVITVRYYVGEDRENSRSSSSTTRSTRARRPGARDGRKLGRQAGEDRRRPARHRVTLWSEDPERYDDHQLRRLAEELEYRPPGHPEHRTACPRSSAAVREESASTFDPQRLAGRQASVLHRGYARRCKPVSVSQPAERHLRPRRIASASIDTGTFARRPAPNWRNLVVQASDNGGLSISKTISRRSWTGRPRRTATAGLGFRSASRRPKPGSRSPSRAGILLPLRP